MEIAVAKGDGVGPELMDSVIRIFNAAGVPLEYTFVNMGKDVYLGGESTGMTPEARDTVERLGVLFKGPMETPKGNGVKSINVSSRKLWNTYANIRTFRCLPNIHCFKNNVNIIIVRENIEDTYGAIEHMQTHDVAQCRRLITRPGCLQLHKRAFKLARERGITKVTCCHKANIMKLTDGLFLECFYKVAKEYPQITADDIIVDNLCLQLTRDPSQFEMIVAPNLQGDIISDLCAGLVGGLGVCPSMNIGDQISVFEAVHGTAPDIAGKGIANPIGLLLTGIGMLEYLGLYEHAGSIQTALEITLQNDHKTKDLGGTLNTEDFTDQIIQRIVPHKDDGGQLTRPVKPIQHVMRVTHEPVKRTVGMDIFIDSGMRVSHLAHIIGSSLFKDYKLVMISNRGTQVWPNGSMFTEMVNHYRCRIVNYDAPREHELWYFVSTLHHRFRICSVELLLEIDGVPGFSLAQGQ